MEREESQRILTPDYTEATAENFQSSEAWADFFTYRSGYLRKLDLHALEELAIFGKAWEVYTEGYIPLLLKGKKFPISDSRQNLFSITIECSPALQRKNYSNVLIPIEDTEEGWLIVPEGYWKTVFGKIWGIV